MVLQYQGLKESRACVMQVIDAQIKILMPAPDAHAMPGKH